MKKKKSKQRGWLHEIGQEFTAHKLLHSSFLDAGFYTFLRENLQYLKEVQYQVHKQILDS